MALHSYGLYSYGPCIVVACCATGSGGDIMVIAKRTSAMVNILVIASCQLPSQDRTHIRGGIRVSDTSNVCIDMCVDMLMDMRTDMCIVMCLEMCTDLCTYMCIR